MPDYEMVNGGWGDPLYLPAITGKEAMHRAMMLSRKFGDGSVPFSGPRYRTNIGKRSWASTEATRNERDHGWRNMVHDVSHWVHLRNHRGYLKSHSRVHAAMELSMIQYVLLMGWTKPKGKAKPTLDEKRAKALGQTRANIKRWLTKEKRARTALKKLRVKERRLIKLVPDTGSAALHA